MQSPVWQGCGVICVGIWIGMTFFRGGFWRLRERLRVGPGFAASKVVVAAVIPARDEAGLIERAVESLRKQRFTGTLRITVADDESSDGTGARALGAGADRAIRVGTRPAGWKGKLWAVSEGVGAEEDSAEYFLLTDADIEYVSDGLLEALLAKQREGFDLVSVMVRLCCESAAEQFLIPAFVFFFFMLYPPGWVARKRGVAAAAGGCMLIRRETLERLGGIGSFRDALIDDCALAGRVKAVGGRVWLGISELEIRSIRPYEHWAEIRMMIARAAFSQLRHSAWLLAGTVAGLLLTYVMPVALLFSGDRVAAGLGAAAWLMSAAIFLPTVRYYGAPRWTVFALPAIACFYLFATVESAVNYWTGRGGAWKGRVQDELR